MKFVITLILIVAASTFIPIHFILEARKDHEKLELYQHQEHEILVMSRTLHVAWGMGDRGGFMGLNDLECQDLARQLYDKEIDWKWIAATMHRESGFNPLAKSSSNAKGLMQLLDSTFKECMIGLGLPYDPSKIWMPLLNVSAGTYFLSKNSDLTVDHMLRSYLVGPSKPAVPDASPLGVSIKAYQDSIKADFERLKYIEIGIRNDSTWGRDSIGGDRRSRKFHPPSNRGADAVYVFP